MKRAYPIAIYVTLGLALCLRGLPLVAEEVESQCVAYKSLPHADDPKILGLGDSIMAGNEAYMDQGHVCHGVYNYASLDPVLGEYIWTEAVPGMHVIPGTVCPKDCVDWVKDQENATPPTHGCPDVCRELHDDSAEVWSWPETRADGRPTEDNVMCAPGCKDKNLSLEEGFWRQCDAWCGPSIREQWERNRDRKWKWVVLAGGGNDLLFRGNCVNPFAFYLSCKQKTDELISNASGNWQGHTVDIVNDILRSDPETRVVIYGYHESQAWNPGSRLLKSLGAWGNAALIRLSDRYKMFAAQTERVFFLDGREVIKSGEQMTDVGHLSRKGSRDIGERLALCIASDGIYCSD